MYSEYQPCHLLSAYVDKYWEFKGKPLRGTRINILPDGCTDFIFTLGEVAQVAGERSLLMQPYRSFFVGPMNRYSELVVCTGSVHMLGIRFLPCGLLRFMNLPLDELGNQRVHTVDLKTIFDSFSVEKLCALLHIRDRIEWIEKYLINALKQPDLTDRQITLAVNQINHSRGKQTVRALMEDICICQRHFERKFKLHTGFSPKEYSRIVKFRNALDLLRNTSSGNLLTVAVAAGYYDVAHLCKEIKTLSGSTASSFSALDLPEDLTLTYTER